MRGRTLRYVNLSTRDRHAILGPGGLTLILKEGSENYKFRVPGIESIDVSRKVPSDEIVIHLIDRRNWQAVDAWMRQFIRELYERRAATEQKLRETTITRL